MRKTLTLFLIGISFLTFNSCKKKSCWICEKEMRSTSSLQSMSKTKEVYCDMTESEIREIEKSNTYGMMDKSKIEYKIKTNCIEQENNDMLN